MSFPVAAAVAAAALLASPGAFAQLYKCQQDGRTAYQERPCTTGSNETRMAGVTGWAAQWVGCYEAPRGPGPVRHTRDLRVRGVANGLVLDVEGANESLPLRRMAKEELQVMEEGMATPSGGARFPDGLATSPKQEQRGLRRDAPHGIYRMVYPDGREELRVALPTVSMVVQKAPCKAP